MTNYTETRRLSHNPKEEKKIKKELKKIEEKQEEIEKQHPNIPFQHLYYGGPVSPAVVDTYTPGQIKAYEEWHQLENDRVRLSTPVL